MQGRLGLSPLRAGSSAQRGRARLSYVSIAPVVSGGGSLRRGEQMLFRARRAGSLEEQGPVSSVYRRG